MCPEYNNRCKTINWVIKLSYQGLGGIRCTYYNMKHYLVKMGKNTRCVKSYFAKLIHNFKLDCVSLKCDTFNILLVLLGTLTYENEVC